MPVENPPSIAVSYPCLRNCPHALGWRGEEAYVLGLVLNQRREPVVDGASWEWLMERQWIRP